MVVFLHSPNLNFACVRLEKLKDRGAGAEKLANEVALLGVTQEHDLLLFIRGNSRWGSLCVGHETGRPFHADKFVA